MEFYKTGLEKQTSVNEESTASQDNEVTNKVTVMELPITEETPKPNDSAEKDVKIEKVPVKSEALKVPEKKEIATENKAPTET
jgi:hypothetical protein